MKLISMTDFVLTGKYTATDTMNYAQFLKTTLNLGMFVPCDENNNVLEKPIIPWQDNIEHEGLHNMYKSKLKKYQQAQYRVLFEDVYGIEYIQNIILCRCSTIEDLLSLKIVSFELTKSAQKQLGL